MIWKSRQKHAAYWWSLALVLVLLGDTHMHEGRGPVWQLHHGSGVVMYSGHLASLQHLPYSLTCYGVQHAAPW